MGRGLESTQQAEKMTAEDQQAVRTCDWLLAAEVVGVAEVAVEDQALGFELTVESWEDCTQLDFHLGL